MTFKKGSDYLNCMQTFNIEKKIVKNNTVVDNGPRGLIDVLIGQGYQIRNIGIGTGTTATNPAVDNDLETPAPEGATTPRLAIPAGGRFRTDKALTISMLIGTTRFDRPVDVTELAIFFDPFTTGDMFARAVITAVTLGVGQAGRFDYEIQF
jgi:hypothetical protein